MNPLPRPLALLAALLLLPLTAPAQKPKSDPVALPKPVAPATPPPAAPQPPAPDAATPLPAADATPPAAAPKSAGKGGVILNFQNASLTDVLNYLSEAAGFIVVQETPVTGTVNVTSRQEVSPDEAVDLVNAVLIEKGFVAIRNGRILKIVPRKDAQKRDLPVRTGSDPEQIPRKDEMVTQILPLRYGEAAKLVENLQTLLSENATISSNESANSIILTDTQTNIRRIATIIRAIDTSVASISTIHVYPLRFADAKELATIITSLFQTNSTSGGGGGRNRGGGGGGGGPLGGIAAMFGGGPPGGSQGSSQSEARQAASRIVAVSDEQSNSLIVSAPEDLIPSITEVVEKLDTSIDAVTETRIFRLQHADATEMAETLTKIYSDSSNSSSSQNRNGQRNQGGRGGGGPFGGFFPGQQPQQNGSQQSERALLQAKVVAVGDPRTNALVVTAARETMTQIAETVGRLDATDAKKQRVFVHQLEHADVESAANVLRGMLGDQSAITTTQGGNRLQNRSSNGATMDTSDVSNTGTGGGGGGRAGR